MKCPCHVISPRAGEMPGRAEGGNVSPGMSLKVTPSVTYGDISPLVGENANFSALASAKC